MGTRISAIAALVTVSLFFLYEFVARIEPSIATDEISKDLALSATEFGLISSLFFWIYAPMQIVVGLLLDRYGLRRFVLVERSSSGSRTRPFLLVPVACSQALARPLRLCRRSML